MNRTKQKPGTRGGYTVCATCESMIDFVKRYGSEMRYCPECQWYEWLIDGEWQEPQPTDISAKNQAAIDMLLSWRDGDPQEEEETLRVIEDALAKHECQQVKHCWVEEYYGHRCQNCGLFYPFDCAPWDEVS